MFHRIRSVSPMDDRKLCVQFSEGVTKEYDIKPLYDIWPIFQKLINNDGLFRAVYVDIGGYGIIWDDTLDISCNELWYNGKTIETPFDDLMAFSDATRLWGLNESTLRKAVTYGKLVNGRDICKFGKQWVISKSAMEREYGNPKNDIEITAVEFLEKMKLLVTFSTGEDRILDLNNLEIDTSDISDKEDFEELDISRGTLYWEKAKLEIQPEYVFQHSS